MKHVLSYAAAICLFCITTSFGGKGVTPDTYYIIIDKSDNTLTIYDKDDWIVQYPCTFGNADLSEKMYQGDRRTPEGVYHINAKYPHKKWRKFLSIDYPSAADRAKFEQRKKTGQIPKTAKIGGSIGIHGTWPREDFAVEYLQNWTEGCISVMNVDVDEIYDMLPVGTKVIIRK